MSVELEPTAYAYKKLFGKRATNLEFAIKVSQMSTGDMQKGTPPMTQKEIMITLGFKDKKSIQRFMNLARKEGVVDDSKKEAFKLSDYKYLASVDDFLKLPSVETWVTDMKGRARGGKPFGGLAVMVRKFKIVCDSLEVDPMQFISGINREEVLNQGKIYMNNFIEMYFKKEAKIQYAKNWSPERQNKIIISYSYSKAVRDFMRIHGYNYPEGTGGSMSQSISSFHGNYSDVRMTLDEYRKGKEYIKSKYGLDSDEYRCFWIGVEAAPRNMAMWGMTLDYTTHTSEKTGKTTYIMSAYESKTKQIKGGKWTKYITRPDTQKSIDLLKSRGGAYIYEQHKYYYSTDRRLKAFLRELYKFLGKEFTHLERQNDTSTGYFMTHPFHALRHIGAHYWLIKKKYNFGLVAKLGGWHTIDELKNSYGEMPPEVVLELLEED